MLMPSEQAAEQWHTTISNKRLLLQCKLLIVTVDRLATHLLANSRLSSQTRKQQLMERSMSAANSRQQHEDDR